MVERMDTQIELLSRITEELIAIHKAIKAPLSTAFNELFNEGARRCQEQLWDKALEVFLDAEKKNDVHPLLQLKIGQLYLQGCNRDCNVIDFAEAERHLLLSARYSEAKRESLHEWRELCGQAYFHAAQAAYLIGEQKQAAGQPDMMRSCLERALGYLAKAVMLWPQVTETIYTQAKCHALLGQVPDAVAKLEVLSDRDRRYFAKSARDGDFVALRAEAEAAFRQATRSLARWRERPKRSSKLLRRPPSGRSDLARRQKTWQPLTLLSASSPGQDNP